MERIVKFLLKLGRGTNTSHTMLEFDLGLATNPAIRAEASTNELQFRKAGGSFQSFGSGSLETISGADTLDSSNNGGLILLDASGGAFALTLPSPSSNYRVTLKDKTGDLGDNPVTLTRAGTENIEGLAADYDLAAPWGVWEFVSDGTDWFLI